jgi:CTP:molybdopterin cytidylyltransferase MocA
MIPALLLAAGGSTRMGSRPKGLLPLPDGTFVLERMVRTCREAGVGTVHVVIGHEAERHRRRLARLPVVVVENPAWESGRTSSVKAGLRSLPPGTSACLLWPVDAPLVRRSTVQALLERERDRAPEARWTIPLYQGRRGHPVLLSSATFPAVEALEDPEPLFRIPREHPEWVELVELGDPGTTENTDDPEAFLQALQRLSKERVGPGDGATDP